MDMNIKNLEDLLPEIDPIKYPVTIQFSKSEEQRWCRLRERLRRINPRLRIALYARHVLIDMMGNLEKLIDEREKKIVEISDLQDEESLLSVGNKG